MIRKALLAWLLVAVAAQASVMIELEKPAAKEEEKMLFRDMEQLAAERRALVSTYIRLHEMLIPKIEFRDLTIKEILLLLYKKTGIPMVALLPAVPEAPTLDHSQIKITLSLTNVPLTELLRYVTSLAELKYRVEPGAVLFEPNRLYCGTMVTEEWNVPHAVAGKINKEFLKSRGVSLPTGSTLNYNILEERLIIHSTEKGLDRIYDILVDLSLPPATRQEIEAEKEKYERTWRAERDRKMGEWEAENLPEKMQSSWKTGVISGPFPRYNNVQWPLQRLGTTVLRQELAGVVVHKAEIRDTPVEEVFRELEAKLPCKVAAQVEPGTRVTLSMQNAPVMELLNKIAEQTQTRVVIGAGVILFILPMVNTKQ